MEFDDLVTQLYEGLEQYYNSESSEEKEISEAHLRHICLDVVKQKEKAFPVHYKAILAFVADGLSNRKIAEELELSERTIKNYLSIIYHILGTNNRTQAVLVAAKMGLITLEDENGN